MKCTQCSRKVSPVVVIDIDGTIGNYHSHFARFAWGYWDLTVRPTRQHSWAGNGEFEEWLGLTKVQYREAKLAYRQGGMKRNMPLLHGSHELIQAIKQEGAELWIATTRPWMRLDNIDPDTREWLRRNNIPFDGLLYGEDKYAQLVEVVEKQRVVAVLDDLPEQCDRARELGLPAIQRANDHNHTHTQRRKPRLDIGEAQYAITTRLREWRKKYDSSSILQLGEGGVERDQSPAGRRIDMRTANIQSEEREVRRKLAAQGVDGSTHARGFKSLSPDEVSIADRSGDQASPL